VPGVVPGVATNVVPHVVPSATPGIVPGVVRNTMFGAMTTTAKSAHAAQAIFTGERVQLSQASGMNSALLRARGSARARGAVITSARPSEAASAQESVASGNRSSQNPITISMHPTKVKHLRLSL
jgi:hypothetical protein